MVARRTAAAVAIRGYPGSLGINKLKYREGEPAMGLIYTDIDLSNPRDDALSPLTVNALVDTGSITLCVPEHVAVQLDLKELERREVTTADGKHVLVPYVGPVRVKFENRSCYTGALVLGDGVLLGSIPLEDMDLVVNSRLEKVTVNPESPNIPSAVVKQAAGLVLRSGASAPSSLKMRV